MRLGYPESRKWSDEEKAKKMDELREKFIVPVDKMRLIISYCIYNEEQYFEKSLEECLKINDFDTIHILDGAWEHGGTTPNSTDRSHEIAMNFAKKHGVDLIWVDNPHDRLWKSESEKRNYQLKDIEKRYPDSKYYVLVRDGDELIRWTSGRNSTWMKKDLVDWHKSSQNVGIINTYAYHSDFSTMQGIRLIPSGSGIHYYTGRGMVVHDGECGLLLNYNPREGMQGNPERVFIYQSFFFVNLWNIRNEERQDIKDKFADWQATQKDVGDRCEWNE